MKLNKQNNFLSPDEQANIVRTLQARFAANMHRHKTLTWDGVQSRLEQKKDKLWSLYEMERTGGEPDVVGLDHKTGEYIFYDCAPESPKGRRSLCYDREALLARKAYKPKSSASDMAKAMGIEILSEVQYQELQQIGEYDLKTSSWLITPLDVRELGGAIFADRRYNRVFVFHNGADSYYSSRGFRGVLRI